MKFKTLPLAGLLLLTLGFGGEEAVASLSEVEMSPESISGTEESDSRTSTDDESGKDSSGLPNVGIDPGKNDVGSTDPGTISGENGNGNFFDWFLSQFNLNEDENKLNNDHNNPEDQPSASEKASLLELLKKGEISPALLVLLLGSSAAGALLAVLLLGGAGVGGVIGLSLVAGFLLSDSMGMSDGASFQLLQLLLASSIFGGTGGFLIKRFNLLGRFSSIFNQPGSFQRLLSLLSANKVVTRLFHTLKKGKIPFLRNLAYAFTYALRKTGKTILPLWNALKTPFVYLADYYNKFKKVFGSNHRKSDTSSTVDTIESVYEFTTDKELAALANISYTDGQGNITLNLEAYGLDDKWQYLKEYHTESGLDAVVYQRVDEDLRGKKEIIFAIRGTEGNAVANINFMDALRQKEHIPFNVFSKDFIHNINEKLINPIHEEVINNDGVKDIWTDITDVVGGKDSRQVQDAKDIYLEFKNEFKNENYETTFVGHSLGGFIATHLSDAYQRPAFTFNSPGLMKHTLDGLENGYEEMVHFYVEGDEVATYDLNTSIEIDFITNNPFVDAYNTDYVRNNLPGENIVLPYLSDGFRPPIAGHSISQMYFNEDGTAFTIEDLKREQSNYVNHKKTNAPITPSTYYKELEQRNLRAREVRGEKFLNKLIDNHNLTTVRNTQE
ncbi:hypothetical protein LCM10_18740 [Rossellomorea aquimaris]|uniref:hypothetical protein n=1 Tax=Rossellomorea aquimaris TaxID=189382 RepID=UPI001CD1B5A1|nr:hypothetical protein [Rossellomorea aquimaris]MCA1057005.1 hypothetical protein [Rossellomorea aquimaris]